MSFDARDLAIQLSAGEIAGPWVVACAACARTGQGVPKPACPKASKPECGKASKPACAKPSKKAEGVAGGFPGGLALLRQEMTAALARAD